MGLSNLSFSRCRKKEKKEKKRNARDEMSNYDVRRTLSTNFQTVFDLIQFRGNSRVIFLTQPKGSKKILFWEI